MDNSRKVDLVRVPREEQYYAVEDVLGRDIKSVFPNESKKAALQTDAAQAILQAGNKKFISEIELAEIKTLTGGKGRVEDGSIAADKPLAVILQEQREAKDAQFKEQWKQMKTGKNRPLDEDELEFLDGIAEAENAKRKREAEEEAAELDAFHQALKAQQEAQAKAEAEALEAKEKEKEKASSLFGSVAGAQNSGGSGKSKAKPAINRKPNITAIVKPKRSLGTSKTDSISGTQEKEGQIKKQKVVDNGKQEDYDGDSDKQEEEKEEQGCLAGLLGDYGSDSD